MEHLISGHFRSLFMTMTSNPISLNPVISFQIIIIAEKNESMWTLVARWHLMTLSRQYWTWISMLQIMFNCRPASFARWQPSKLDLWPERQHHYLEMWWSSFKAQASMSSSLSNYLLSCWAPNFPGWYKVVEWGAIIHIFSLCYASKCFAEF